MFVLYGLREIHNDDGSIDPIHELIGVRQTEEEAVEIVKKLFLTYKGTRYRDFYHKKIEDFPCIKELYGS